LEAIHLYFLYDSIQITVHSIYFQKRLFNDLIRLDIFDLMVKIPTRVGTGVYISVYTVTFYT